MPSLPRGIKIYRKLRYRKGHGVHSPFAYNLITKVIEEKSPYYIFDEIEKIREELLTGGKTILLPSASRKFKKSSIAKIALNETQHKKYGALLFRLVNYFKYKHVLHIGANTGIMSFYLSSSQSDCVCIALERRDELAQMGQQRSRELKKNVRFVPGEYTDSLREVLTAHKPFDLIFVDLANDPQCAEKIIHICLDGIQEKGALVIDGIKKSKKMISLWKSMKENPQTGISVDLHALGLVFFNKKIHKQHYKTYFDYGEKQNIYKVGRQRINIFSRRKKNF